MAAKKTDKKTSAAKPKATAVKKAAPKAAAAKTEKKAAVAKPAAKKAVARPVVRTVAPPAPRRAQQAAPAQPRKQREVRPLPQVPAGHAALIGADGASGETLQLPEILTTATGRSELLFQAFNASRANARQGNAATKNRARVSGGGAKPWAQKGTGRARAGSTRSPLWRHGGVVFGPNGRTYWQRLPEKMRKAAFAEAFADQASRGRVLVFDALPNGETPKTSAMREWLGRIGDTGKTVVVVDGVAESASKALANLPRVELRSSGTLRLEDVLNGETLLVQRGSIDALALRAGEEKAVSA